MSILTDILPDFVVVDGEKAPIRTSYKVWLQFSKVLTESCSDEQKTAKLLMLVFYDMPTNLHDAIGGMMEFYSHTKKEHNESAGKSTFDFDYDADLIYSAFLQQYKIDLTEADMHWWKFKSLFESLSEDTQFIKVVQFRCTDTSKIKDKEQKRYYRKMKALHKLPDNRSEAQKEQQLNDIMAQMF